MENEARYNLDDNGNPTTLKPVDNYLNPIIDWIQNGQYTRYELVHDVLGIGYYVNLKYDNKRDIIAKFQNSTLNEATNYQFSRIFWDALVTSIQANA